MPNDFHDSSAELLQSLVAGGGGMIVVELAGGLGNQMFEYAIGRKLSLLAGSDLSLYTAAFEADPLRDYALSCFNIVERFAEERVVRKMKYGVSGDFSFAMCDLVSKVMRRLGRVNPCQRSTYIIERKASFCPEVLEVGGDAFLSGYWQTEKYFSSIRDILLRDFSFKETPDNLNRQLLDQIRSVNSVSVHVRRGDFLSDPKSRELHHCCDENYYKRAFREIVDRVQDPHFFVFSDEPDWVRQNFEAPGEMTVVDLNSGARSHEDMRLMSQCKSNLIANSSFSWWGAWLNECDGKVVVAPRRWYNSNEIDTTDLAPSGWVKV